MSLETTLLNLRILSKVEQNGRICRSHNGLIALEPGTPVGRLLRVLRMDGRQQSLLDLKGILTAAFEKVDALLDSHSFFDDGFREARDVTSAEYRSKLERLELLRDGLHCCQAGLSNLKTTYSADPTIVAELDLLCFQVQSAVKRVHAKLGPAH